MTGLDAQLWWHLARAAGIVAWILLGAAVVWGLLLSTRLLQRRRKPAWLLDLHRWLGGLALTFTTLHMLALVLDEYVHFGPVELLVPFTSQFEPAAVAWGIVAFHLLVAIQVSSLMMRRLPRRLWKVVHSSAFVVFWATSIHAALAGTDTSSGWYRAIAAALLAVVVFAVAYRVLAGPARAASRAGETA